MCWSHNFVHFHFLDIAAKCRNEVVPRESVLGHLLNAHLRFTSCINEAGTSGGWDNPSGNYSIIGDQYSPWKIQPYSEQQFVFKVAQNCSNYYLDIDETTGKVNTINFDQFPPQWVKDRMQSNDDNFNSNKNGIRGLIPYLDFCTDYYIAIQRFIDNLWLNDISRNNHRESLLEKDIVYQFIHHVESHGMPGISQVDPQTVLATLIWTGAILHSGDHILFGKIFDIYGYMVSPCAWNSDDKWTDILQGSFRVNQFKAFQTKCFIDMFVKYNKSWLNANDTLSNKKLYQNFKYVPHIRRRKHANKVHKLFLQDLEYVNQQWRWMLDVKDLAASTSF